MTDEPSKLFESDGYCQKTLVIAKQNVIFALAVGCWCWCSARSVLSICGLPYSRMSEYPFWRF